MRKIHPTWSAAILTVAYLLTLPLMCRIYAEQLRKAGGFYLEILLSVWVVFPLLMVPAYLVLKLVLQHLDNSALRIAFLVLCAAAILSWHGMPGLFAIGTGIVLVAGMYHENMKIWNDARALEQFDANGN